MKNGLILFAMIAVFVLAAMYTTPAMLVVMLNGIFVGSVVSFLFVLRTLAWNAFAGKIIYPDVRTFTMGLLLVLFGICCWFGTSIYINASDIRTPSFMLLAIARYAVTCGILTMAYAPGSGGGFMEGADRKAIAISVVVGSIVGAAVVWLQAAEVLAATP